MTTLTVDNQEIQAKEGSTLLQACLDNGLYIPNLCFLEQMSEPPASCRMCLVEIEGQSSPIPACTVMVESDMKVATDTDAVRKLQKTAFQLFMSAHDVDCGNCPANKKCDLQKIAKHLKIGLKPGKLEQRLKTVDAAEDAHPVIDYFPNRCVLCGKCIFTCKEKHGQSMLSFAKRGLDTIISFYGQDGEKETGCGQCLACIEICPVAALVMKDSS